jgi:hypothetical protein
MQLKWNESDGIVREAKRLIGLEVHQDGVNNINPLEYRSGEIEINTKLMPNWKKESLSNANLLSENWEGNIFSKEL